MEAHWPGGLHHGPGSDDLPGTPDALTRSTRTGIAHNLAAVPVFVSLPADAPASPLRSVQRLERCDRDQILHGIGELPIERDQRVGVELSQCDVLGVERIRPPE
jgi:hypothetical protein